MHRDAEINTGRFSPEEFMHHILLVRSRQERLAGVTKSSRCRLLDSRSSLQQSRIKLFPLDGWKCDQSTSHSLAPQALWQLRGASHDQTDVCCLLFKQAHSERKSQATVSYIHYWWSSWWLWHRGTMHRSLIPLLVLLCICPLSCCHLMTLVVVGDACFFFFFSGKTFDWTQVWLSPTAAPPARQLRTGTSTRHRGEVGMREPWLSRFSSPARKHNGGKWQLSCLWKSCNFYISPSY